jgi:hypothetical protein
MIARRLGQGSPSRNRSTSDLSEFLYVRNHFSVLLLGLLRLPLLIFCPGRDRDYQNLNLGFAINVVILGAIVSWFPKPLKLCVVPPLSVFLCQ